jgi:hypothetical protein
MRVYKTLLILLAIIVTLTQSNSTNCVDDRDCLKNRIQCGGVCENNICVYGTTCSAEKPVCYNSNCVECTKESGCLGNRVCHGSEQKCVECNSNFDCTFDSLRRICDSERNICVQCENKEDCERNSRCGSM